MKKKWIIAATIIVLIATLWMSGVIPRQIANISGTAYVRKHFPKMRLECIGVEWANVYGSYLIAFSDGDEKIYSCLIGPQIFPVSLGQGLFSMESDYAEHYK